MDCIVLSLVTYLLILLRRHQTDGDEYDDDEDEEDEDDPEFEVTTNYDAENANEGDEDADADETAPTPNAESTPVPAKPKPSDSIVPKDYGITTIRLVSSALRCLPVVNYIYIYFFLIEFFYRGKYYDIA